MPADSIARHLAVKDIKIGAHAKELLIIIIKI
jgi:hypothetical protein